MIKVIIFLAGLASICIGIIGLMLPVIPQIPFLVLGVLLLCTASKRFKRMFVGTALYQRYIKSLVDSHEKIREFMEADNDND